MVFKIHVYCLRTLSRQREQFKINFKLFGDFGDFDLSHYKTNFIISLQCA
eukprot:SAG31_NODE_832_length_11660_cov_2.612091_5_plen_50_part_00